MSAGLCSLGIDEFGDYFPEPYFSENSGVMIPLDDPFISVQDPVVQRLDGAIHRINHYPADKSLSGG